MGGWRRRLQESDYTDFCANFPEWGTFYNLAEKSVMYIEQTCLAAAGVEQSVCDSRVAAAQAAEACAEDYAGEELCFVGDEACTRTDPADEATTDGSCTYFSATENASTQYTTSSCSVATCGANNDAECTNQSDCETEYGVWAAWTDNENNPAGNATPQECDTLRIWADERKSFIQDPDNQGAPGYADALHTMILLENHYACCTIRSGTALQIMDLLSRINLLCSSHDSSVCAVAQDDQGQRDCDNVFAVCPAVTAPNGQGLDLDAIGNYGAVVIDVNTNFQGSSAERRRMTDENCPQLNAQNAMAAGTPEGKASLLLSWGTEYYGQQLGHVALIIGDLDHTQDKIPDERWVSFGPASNSADYQSAISLGDTYDLLQGMKPRISSFANEYGLFDDYITFNNVDEQAMVAAWETIRNNPGRYSLIDRNCMTVVAEIMNAGMAEACALETRNLITPHAFFQAMQDDLAEQLVAKDAEKSELLKPLFEAAFTLEKEDVRECSEMCDLPDTHPFHCERTSYFERAQPRFASSGRNVEFRHKEKIGVECMQLAKDMKCQYGSLCRNPNYQDVEDNCSVYQKKTECVNARIWKNRVEDLKRIERESMCIWKGNSCQDYTPGDCAQNEMQTLADCNDNHHVCELESYRASPLETTCADISVPSCPSVGGFTQTPVGEEAASRCRSGFVGTASRKCLGHNDWGMIDASKCTKIPLRVVDPQVLVAPSAPGSNAPVLATDAPAPIPAPQGRRMIVLDELAELTL